MKLSRVFEVAARPDQVMAYFSIPRNLFVANNLGPTLAESGPPFGVGSWADLAFGQLRVRVDYDLFEPPIRIGYALRWSGRGSRNATGRYAFQIDPIAATGRTRLTVFVEAPKGWLPRPLAAIVNRLSYRRLQQRIEAFAAGGAA